MEPRDHSSHNTAGKRLWRKVLPTVRWLQLCKHADSHSLGRNNDFTSTFLSSQRERPPVSVASFTNKQKSIVSGFHSSRRAEGDFNTVPPTGMQPGAQKGQGGVSISCRGPGTLGIFLWGYHSDRTCRRQPALSVLLSPSVEMERLL